MESGTRGLLSKRYHRNPLCLRCRERAPRDAASSVVVGAGGYRDHFYFHGFYFQNFCPAFGGTGADGNYLCGVFLTPEVSSWLAWRYGRDRRGHSTWLVVGHNDREDMDFDLCADNAGFCRWFALGGAVRSRLFELFFDHFSNGNFQRRWFPAEHRKCGSSGRQLPYLSLPHG